MTLPSRCYVVGLARSGISVAKWLKKQNRLFGVWDDTPDQLKLAQGYGFPALDPEVAFSKNMAPDALILSPGIPHTYPRPHLAAVLAKKHGVPILGDIELYGRAFPQGRYIGITGTNGKSTTTALITHMLNANDTQAVEGGNIGVPCFDQTALSPDIWRVFELSSYQLDLSPTFSPAYFVLLNITPDHLDRYASYDAYAAAKLAPLAHLKKEAVAFISQDSVKTKESTPAIQKFCPGQVHPFSGADLPFSLENCPTLPGGHNRENAAAAWQIGRAFGFSDAQILRSFESYPGLPHRQERVYSNEHLLVVNDSKATNFEAASKAVASYENIHWLVGGIDKGDSIMALSALFPKVRHVYFFGASGAKLQEDLQQQLPSMLFTTLEDATRGALKAAGRETHATILLSPACASFDEFKNFEHRGEVYKNLVRSILK